MKILLCTNTFGTIANGPTKFANLLYQNGVRNGFEVHILSEDILTDQERLHNVSIGILKKFLPLAPIYRMVKYYFKADRLNKLHHFDYVIYNNAIYGLIHAICKPDVVGMINDYGNQKNISKTRSGFNYESVKKRIFKMFEKRAIIYSKLILTNSDYLNNLLQAAYPAYYFKIKKLVKGIDLDTGSVKNQYNWAIEELSCIKILFVKTDFLTGGIEVLAKSLSLINLPFSVTIIGPPANNTDQITSIFETSSVFLVFLGTQPQEKVFELMADHHIFCVPSLQEAFGVGNLEALHIGIPVVSSNAGGIPEVLDYGNCGFISSAGDPGSLKSCLELCIYDKNLRCQKAENGFEHAKKFSHELIFNNLRKLINESP